MISISELSLPERLKKGMVENVDYVLFPAPVAHQMFSWWVGDSIILLGLIIPRDQRL